MEQDRRYELIDLAIQKCIQDSRNSKGTQQFCETNDDDAEYELALTHLLSASQLQVFQRDELLKQSEASTPSELVAAVIQKIESEDVDADEEDPKDKGTETSEIVKELKKVKRQNFVTHCLLSVMIVLTLAWQLSEVSLIMKLKDGISHPFRSFGSMLKGMVKVPDKNSQEGGGNKEQQQSESSSLLSPLKMPEMPQMDVPSLGFNNGKQ